jgi:hypothetical protein
MGHREVTLATLVAAALATGCGSSSKQLTRDQLVAKANTICTELNGNLEALSRTTNNTPSGLFAKAAVYEKTALAGMKQLIPPAALADDWKQIVAGTQTLTDETVTYSNYVKEGKIDQARTVANQYGPVKHEIKDTATSDGITACAHAL